MDVRGSRRLLKCGQNAFVCGNGIRAVVDRVVDVVDGAGVVVVVGVFGTRWT